MGYQQALEIYLFNNHCPGTTVTLVLSCYLEYSNILISSHYPCKNSMLYNVLLPLASNGRLHCHWTRSMLFTQDCLTSDTLLTLLPLHSPTLPILLYSYIPVPHMLTAAKTRVPSVAQFGHLPSLPPQPSGLLTQPQSLFSLGYFRLS